MEGKIDLINIIMIGIAKELPEQDERYELHRLLGALLSQKLTVDEKCRSWKQSTILSWKKICEGM